MTELVIISTVIGIIAGAIAIFEKIFWHFRRKEDAVKKDIQK